MANALYRAVEEPLAQHPRDLIWRSAEKRANLFAAPEKIVVVQVRLLFVLLSSISKHLLLVPQSVGYT